MSKLAVARMPPGFQFQGHVSFRGTRDQAWTLRRAVTLFNQIVGKPHWPREERIQRMIKTLGIEQPPKGDGEEENDEEGLDEEDAESEVETEDEEVPAELHSGRPLVFSITFDAVSRCFGRLCQALYRRGWGC